MVLGKVTPQSEAGEFGSPEEFVAMDEDNQKLAEACIVLVAGDGLQPSSKGKRVAFDRDGDASVIDGPFAEAKELVAGYSIWEVSSMDEAVEWAKRSPFRNGQVKLRMDPRRARSSSVPPGSPRTRPSARNCSPGQRLLTRRCPHPAPYLRRVTRHEAVGGGGADRRTGL
jgi:hypothetical protein